MTVWQGETVPTSAVAVPDVTRDRAAGSVRCGDRAQFAGPQGQGGRMPSFALRGVQNLPFDESERRGVVDSSEVYFLKLWLAVF